MPSLRALLPALANKTYFNNPALPVAEAKIRCLAIGLRDSHGRH